MNCEHDQHVGMAQACSLLKLLARSFVIALAQSSKKGKLLESSEPNVTRHPFIYLSTRCVRMIYFLSRR